MAINPILQLTRHLMMNLPPGLLLRLVEALNPRESVHGPEVDVYWHATIMIAWYLFIYRKYHPLCGFSGNSITALDKRTWIGDINSTFFPLEKFQNSASVTSKAAQQTLSATVPYATARLSRSEFTYVFRVTPGKKFIRLYFFPARYQTFERSNALFSVKVGPYTLLHKFNASLTADADADPSDTIYREFCIDVEDEQGYLNITFIPSPDKTDAYAFVNGIEIVSMPPYLYYSEPDDQDQGAKIIGQPSQLQHIESKTALEMVYRINVGGREISPAEDTGMYRRWSTDNDYLTVPGPRVFPVNLTLRLQFHGIADYTAPEEVYLTARSMGPNSTINKNYSLTWEFPVHYGFMRVKRVEHEGSNIDGTSWWYPFSRSMIESSKTGESSLPSDLCRCFSLTDIRAAINNFDNAFVIGVGGFGNVYKGYIDDGATPVAIKRLKPGSQQGAREFRTEIEMLSHLRHLNLVSLIGYCNEGNEMILVYDYMARGTLRDHLYNSDDPPLSWEQRLRICVGAARGLHYLHRGAKQTIIHRDVKTTNILLDEKWVAKVSDFGLSKTGPTGVSMTHVSTDVKGSFGYLDPEYFRRQQLTEKSDVYSFGVVLCEVICARPPLIRNAETEQVSLAEWVRKCYHSGTLGSIVDPFLTGKIAPECLKKFGEIAVNCLRDDGIERPTMEGVVGDLEFALQLQESRNERKSAIGGTGDDALTCSSGRWTNGKSSSGELSFSNKDTDTLSSGAGIAFSELMDPKGR
ncbi:Receptor-like protein kinase FERONIA [Morella rubra]|uniref:Receptor-like protein kinase FERONIA n=2 Tax=Morella rubra TaxID=262757 RepID=A0A6A1VIA3_9ROSI|nr:Receptor-like protein kinase FERONIA [Morella rubra]